MMLQILKGTNGRFLHNLGQNKLKITTTPQIKDVKVVCFDINRASSFIYLLIDLLFGRGRGGGGEGEEGRGKRGRRGRGSFLFHRFCLFL